MDENLQKVLDGGFDPPPTLVDPRTNRAYVLLPVDDYERLKAPAEQEDELRDTYHAQMESAERAGWSEPIMGEYDQYDEHCR